LFSLADRAYYMIKMISYPEKINWQDKKVCNFVKYCLLEKNRLLYFVSHYVKLGGNYVEIQKYLFCAGDAFGF
jgi:hypothetical protein